MRIAVIGRSRPLLDACTLLLGAGHEIPLVITRKAADYYDVGEQQYAEFAESVEANFITNRKLVAPETMSSIVEANCDIAISVNWPTKISQSVREKFPKGVLNAHAGDLPRYRGNATPNWAILNRERYLGLCIHFMTEEYDSGAVVLRERFQLSDQTYIGDIYAWLHSRIPELFVRSVARVSSGKLAAEEQSNKKRDVLRCYPRRPEDSLIDWKGNVLDVHRLIRASSRPFSGAFSYYEGIDKVSIWRASPITRDFQFSAVPGQICYSDDGSPVVACADGLIRLDEVSVESVTNASEAMGYLTRSFRARLKDQL